MTSNKIRVAISGGGVAGATVLYALLQHLHIDAHIFESAHQFKEAGVAFGITKNAFEALELMSADHCLQRAGGVEMQGVRYFLAEGEGKGEMVYEADNKNWGRTTTIVQRANLLRELLAGIPGERIHASKKLERVEKCKDGSLVLSFADGSTHDCDILIGADGIRSTVRRAILGDEDPAAHPKNTGWWAIMTLQPYDKARTSIGDGPIDIKDAREMSWIGDNVFLLHNIVSNGEMVQFSVCSKDEDAEGTQKWQKTVTVDEVERVFASEKRPQHLNRAVRELLCDKPEQPAIYFWDHLPARTYVDGGLVVIGDAAHATTPWQGSGGGMSIEDSLILSSLLGEAKDPREARVALQVYDEVRRPRTQRLVESSFKTGQILTGKDNGTGLDAARLKEVMAPRWDFIVKFDNAKHRDEALELMRARLGSA